jgi:hypothetical protein
MFNVIAAECLISGNFKKVPIIREMYPARAAYILTGTGVPWFQTYSTIFQNGKWFYISRVKKWREKFPVFFGGPVRDIFPRP